MRIIKLWTNAVYFYQKWDAQMVFIAKYLAQFRKSLLEAVVKDSFVI